MPAAAAENEPNASELEGQSEGFLLRHSKGLAAFAAAYLITVIIAGLLLTMWDEDEITLHILDALTKILQGIARLAGGWAIECENTYNKYVNALH